MPTVLEYWLQHMLAKSCCLQHNGSPSGFVLEIPSLAVSIAEITQDPHIDQIWKWTS